VGWDSAWIIQHEGAIRFSLFLSVISLFAVAETWRPLMARVAARQARWPVNLGLGAVSSLVMRLALPGAIVLAAVWAQMRGWGALNQIEGPWWLEALVALALLDMTIYVQHVAMHKIPLLWRLHRVHHADADMDVTTAVRFHPVEIVLSALYKIILVVLLGVDPVVVIAYEAMLSAMAVYTHANLRHPLLLERVLRIVIVTPDMHRVHHSDRPAETDSNFGNTLSLWDRLFGTYRAIAQTPLRIGLADVKSERSSQFAWTLMSPFAERSA
jgi:sterol desaturase/sphingolipid hydroxylase (fatty acid hydroxylase superfamily)